MNKKEAEQVLGLSKAYMHQDVVKAYRAKIKTAHPDAGGSTDEAAQINAAKEFMDVLFANDKNAVFSVEPSEVGEASANEAVYEGKTVSRAPQEEPSSAPRHHERQYVAWWEVAYGRNDKRSSVIVNGVKGINEKPDGPLPRWYRFADIMVRRFPWKTSLVLVSLIYFLFIIPYVLGGYTPFAVIVLYALFGAAVVNAITGCFTNSFRKAIRFHADNALFRWQARRDA